MKKTGKFGKSFLSLLACLAMLALSLPFAATATGELTFGTKFSGAWSYDATTDVYSTTDIANNIHYFTADLASGVEFEFQTADISGNFFFNFADEAAAFPENDGFFYDFNHGTGLKVMFHGGFTQSVLMNAKETWGSPVWQENNDKAGILGSGTTFHNDANVWHKVSISKASGAWSVKVNGVELLGNLTGDARTTLDGLLDGTPGYVVVGSNGGAGTVRVREVQKAEAGELTFSALSGAWNYDATTDVYTTTDITNTHYFSGDLEAGVEFEYKASDISSFLFLNIGNPAATFPEGDGFFYDFCHGTGLKLRLKTSGAEVRLITEPGADGWNSPAFKIVNSNIGTAANDDTWHKVSISKAGGAWSVKLDGSEMLSNVPADQIATLNSLLDGDTGNIVVGSNSYAGTVQVRQVKKAPAEKIPLSFKALTNAWNHNAVSGEYTSAAISNTNYIEGDLEAGVEFFFRSSGIDNFFFMNIGNYDAAFKAGDAFFYDCSHGAGLKVAIHDHWTESKLIPADAGWGTPVWTKNESNVSTAGGAAAGTLFHDGETWHKVAISKAGGNWSVKVNGVELLTDLSADNITALNSLLDGDLGYVVFGAWNHVGTVSVCEEIHVHEFSAATCATPATCACGATEGAPTYEHIYENGVCTGCAATEAAEASTFFGYAASADKTALRFGFTMPVAGVVKGDAYAADMANATITLGGVSYPVKEMGGIITNKADADLTFAGVDDSRVLRIPVAKVLEATETEASFAIGIKGIPEQYRSREISCRTYLTYQDGDHTVTIYSDIITHSVQDYITAAGV